MPKHSEQPFQAKILFVITSIVLFLVLAKPVNSTNLIFEAGHDSLKNWLMPKKVPHTKGNEPTALRIELGKKLFFDPRLSKDQNMSCASCHNPMFGWSDGLTTAKGFKSKTLGRASPTIINTAFQTLQMWDGRKKNLEEQALGPMVSPDEMNIGIEGAVNFIQNNQQYVKLFNQAYPNEPVNEKTLAKAIANFESTIISNNSPFDRWVKGDKKAMTAQQINGFKLFVDPNKGNCEVCHSAPNFTDNGFNNVGLASYGKEKPDLGRYAIKPIRILKGAFKTPTLREVVHTAPYFHDGSAKTLEEVVAHYVTGGVVKKDISPNMKPLSLTAKEQADIVAFMHALSTPAKEFTLPTLPKTEF
ncbi:cytochrome-c peroxidase [Aliikangiella sp. IMCC44359]|uniref:cytochrome-c peroxidase n=1 Tax=Aliikangiella sp. IMCC44359 TaxID=3459125 RepID=UPI00403A9DE7